MLFCYVPFFLSKKRLRSFLRLNRRQWPRPRRQPQLRLPYGSAIQLCHMALPYGKAIWLCYMALSLSESLKIVKMRSSFFLFLKTSVASVFDFKSIQNGPRAQNEGFWMKSSPGGGVLRVMTWVIFFLTVLQTHTRACSSYLSPGPTRGRLRHSCLKSMLPRPIQNGRLMQSSPT